MKLSARAAWGNARLAVFHALGVLVCASLFWLPDDHPMWDRVDSWGQRVWHFLRLKGTP